MEDKIKTLILEYKTKEKELKKEQKLLLSKYKYIDAGIIQIRLVMIESLRIDLETIIII